jgi:hypothetical protein
LKGEGKFIMSYRGDNFANAHRETALVSFGRSDPYEVTNDENSTPDRSFASKISILFKNKTNLIRERILLLHTICHRLTESVWDSSVAC